MELWSHEMMDTGVSGNGAYTGQARVSLSTTVNGGGDGFRARGIKGNRESMLV